MDIATADSTPETLRANMVDLIKQAGHARAEEVENALRSVPRHLFVPEADLADAYADMAVITKRADDGAALSCASVPTVVAMMLDQLDVRRGHRVLEIGAGTGYNAALLAALVGPDGSVTTVDIDDEITAGARRNLDTTGNEQVQVITRDGALGADENAPYDRIIVTVGAWDLPTTWCKQLVPDGRLVVPLRWRGQTRSVAFVRDGGLLRAERTDLCGFVPMIGQDGEHSGHFDEAGRVTLHYDVDQPINPTGLLGVLNQPASTVWSGTTVGPYDPFDGVWLNLTAQESGTCRMAAERAAIELGLCKPAIPSRTPAIVEGDSIAYLTFRRLDGRESELGAIGHGPIAAELARRLSSHITGWNQDRAAQPAIIAHPSGTADHELDSGGQIINKHHVRLVVVP